jgi:hypothetical protein
MNVFEQNGIQPIGRKCNYCVSLGDYGKCAGRVCSVTRIGLVGLRSGKLSRIIETNYEGDWSKYVAKWEKQLKSM